MDKAVTRVSIARPHSAYEITVGVSVLQNSGPWASKCLGTGRRKALIVSNSRVFGLFGTHVLESVADTGFLTQVHLIGDGERFKNIRTLEKTLHALSESELKRTDTVVALGGGVVGDLAGFAASIYLRGIRFLQIPTTLLAMIDSSVGGKTGINTPYGKNLTGSFYQPTGVLIDTESLRTLPQRELTAGFCEAIKQGAISGRALFKQIAYFLEKYPVDAFRKHFLDPSFNSELTSLLNAQISFKAKIVQNDEIESTTKMSGRSRKILNFGHTFAHALEKVTDYKYLKHGEAVGYG